MTVAIYHTTSLCVCEVEKTGEEDNASITFSYFKVGQWEHVPITSSPTKTLHTTIMLANHAVIT